MQEYFTYKKLVNFLHGVDDVGEYKSKVHQLENLAALKKYFKDEEIIEEHESEQIDEFKSQLSHMDQAWWNSKIPSMKKRIERDTVSPEALQTQRMLGYLSLIMYMEASGEFNARNYPAASYFVGLYAEVDPKNPEHSYLGACLDMTNHNPTHAMEMLQGAVKLGFSDSKRLQADSNFVTLHKTPEYKKLLKEIAAKPEKLDMTK